MNKYAYMGKDVEEDQVLDTVSKQWDPVREGSMKVGLDWLYVVWILDLVLSISLNSSPDSVKKQLCNPVPEMYSFCFRYLAIYCESGNLLSSLHGLSYLISFITLCYVYNYYAQFTEEETNKFKWLLIIAASEVETNLDIFDPIVLYPTRLYCLSNNPTLSMRKHRFENFEPNP